VEERAYSKDFSENSSDPTPEQAPSSPLPKQKHWDVQAMAQSIAKTMHKDRICSAGEVIDKMMSISKELTRQECLSTHLKIVQHAQAATDVTEF